ncbi:RNA polymerase III RPC4-domain-containing protein [Mycena floridula]|nr:RNA polymerase III RPC4-domain-containing protein [Mycena floridula]
MSGDPGPSSKAIASLVKKSSDVTRQGTQKLKFVPTLPPRRKKEEVKAEPTVAVVPPKLPGRGRGDGRGRGRGRGAARAPPEMTASGPFAMGPAMAAGSHARRSVPHSNFMPSSTAGSSLSGTSTPSVKQEEKGKEKLKVDEEEYSDPDEGVEIIDIENVRNMDWMAPDSLKKERPASKRVKKETVPDGAAVQIDTANALNLSDSEEEEELEDIMENFMPEYSAPSSDADIRQDRLYFFQFPSPFPDFQPAKAADVDVEMVEPSSSKKVTFAPDTKPAEIPEEKGGVELDGVIGHLDIYRSGAVKMRLQNGIVLDVTSATQPSFLQYAVHVDPEQKAMSILGEVNKRFVLSPDIDTLLNAMDAVDEKPPVFEGEETLIRMDTS